MGRLIWAIAAVLLPSLAFAASCPTTPSLCPSPTYNNLTTANTLSVGGAFAAGAGGTLTGTFAGNPTFSGNLTFNGTVSASAGGTLAGTFGGTPTFTGVVSLNGATLSATPLSGGGNAYFGAEVTYSNISGAENTFFGDRAGGAFTGNSNYQTCMGHNACGIGGGAPSVGSNVTAFGNDALRNVYATNPSTITNTDAFGSGALKTLGDGVSVNAITALGAFAATNLVHPSVAPSYTTVVGPFACVGAAAASFYHGTCVGGHTGAALSVAHDFLILGQGVGNTTFASGSGVILIGSGNVTVDTPAAGTNNYINFENIWKVTGTNAPTTAANTISGTLNGGSLSMQNLAGGGNAYYTSEVTTSSISGSENTFFGDRAGSAWTGNSNFNTAFGHNACGLAGGASSVGNSTTCIGTDAGRGVFATGPATVQNFDAVGASALKNYGYAGDTNSISAFGANSMVNLVGVAIAPNWSTAIGPSSCKGAVSAAFWHGFCGGGNTGAALTTAHDFTIIGTSVGNTTFASGSGVILIGSGKVTVDTPAAGTADYINIENIFKTTGTGTPATSITTIAGDTIIGTGSAVATNATTGFLRIATMAGAPTGSTGAAGQAAIVVDTTNKKLCYSTGGGTWECSAAFTP